VKHNDEFTDEELLNTLISIPLYSEIISTKTFKRLKGISFLGAIDYLSKNKKRHNRYDHSVSVGTLALHYATLKQLNEYETKHLVTAALLHDIGHGPLSHSMEPAFARRYGISHHSMTNKIIKGESKLGRELYNILQKNHIDIEYIVALLDGNVSNTTAFALNNPINVDTADGIIRSMSYKYASNTKRAHLALLPKPVEIINALVYKNKRILDEFWSLKHRMYADIIHKPENIKADVVALNFAQENENITLDDFYLTDKMFEAKYEDLFEKLINQNIKTLEYKKRTYIVSQHKMEILNDDDIYEIYMSKKEPKIINLLSQTVSRYQPRLF